MLMHIIQLTEEEEDEDEGMSFNSALEKSDAYININNINSVTVDDEDYDKCFVYMNNEEYFYVDESMEDFIARYQNVLYGTVLTKFYDRSNKQN